MFTRSYLWDGAVQLEDLPFSFNLPHAEFADQLQGIEAEPFQGEGAVQIPLAPAPDVVKRNLLQEKSRKKKKVKKGGFF